MGIEDLFNSMTVAIALGWLMVWFRDLWKANRENKKISIMSENMSKYRWLLKLGMREHAVHFSAFGLRSRNHNSFAWY